MTLPTGRGARSVTIRSRPNVCPIGADPFPNSTARPEHLFSVGYAHPDRSNTAPVLKLFSSEHSQPRRCQKNFV